MVTQKQKKVVVIGAGAGGLSAAVQLARQGWSVCVLEKEDCPGGRLGALESEGYRIDLGATILMMYDVFEQFFAGLGKDINDYLSLTRLNPCYHLNFADGSRLSPSTDLKHNLDEIRSLCPADVEGYLRYLAQIHRRYMTARYEFIEKPMTRLREFLNVKTLAGLMRLKTLNNMYSDISRFVRDERVRMSLTFQSMYLGISPFQTPSIYTIIPYVEHAHSGIWYPHGGMNAITHALVRLLDEFGGELRLKAQVEKILIENNRVKGVLCTDGTTIAADIVVSNVDFPNTMRKLMPEGSTGTYTQARFAHMANSCGCMMFYLGSKQKYDNLGVHNIYFTHEYKKTLDQVFVQKRLPDDPAVYLYAPSRIDPDVAPAGHEVIYILVPVPNLAGRVDWEKEAVAYRSVVYEKLERAGLPGLRQNIVFEKSADPTVFAERFNTFQGAGFGLAPTLFQSGYFRPGIKSKKIAGLYFAGASVHPGGGVPVVLVCGRHVARQIQADYPV
ncbi:MAG: phytoene desaturase [Deltaproteobacteria bacterium]|nr:phytoene desaturase [Deltaproteobacteria bacterium]